MNRICINCEHGNIDYNNCKIRQNPRVEYINMGWISSTAVTSEESCNHFKGNQKHIKEKLKEFINE